MENTKELNTFDKLIIKIQTGDWDDLAYLEITLEKNFSLLKKSTKNDKKVHLKLLSMIEEQKRLMKYHEELKWIHRKQIKEIEPHSGSFESFEA